MRAIAVFSGVCAALAAFSNAAAQPLPVEAFGRLPQISSAAISPDGEHIVFAISNGDQSQIGIFDVDAGQFAFTVEVAEDDQLRGVGWADNERASEVLSRAYSPSSVLPNYVRLRGRPGRIEYARPGVINIASGQSRLLSTDDDEGWRDQGAALIAPIEGDPGYGRLIGRAPSGDQNLQVYRVELDTGRARLLGAAGVNDDTVGYLLDQSGEVFVRLDSDERTNAWSLYVYDREEPRLLLEGVSDIGLPIDVQGLTPDGRIAAVELNPGGEFASLYAIDPADGSRSLLYELDGLDVAGAITDPWTREVVGAAWIDEDVEQYFFEPALQAAYEQVAAVFEGGSARLSSWSADRTRILVYGELGLDGGGYYLLDAGDGSISRLLVRYPEIAQQPEGDRLSITYPARDGTRIPAYLTLPNVDAPEDLPLALLVHGGPHARDTFGFDWWAAFLASRGYAVLQPNFRGSSGYGRSWEDAGRGEWAGLMQTDVEDGVLQLIEAGYVDPDRVCIVGASYGGYAALVGATLTPDRYQCAVSVAGPSDLAEMLRKMETATGSESMTSDWWRQSIGDRWADADQIRAISPANFADNVQIPILLIHGEDDTVVPIEQSRRMRNRLRRADKDFRFVELRGDDHWLSDAPTRIQMLTEIEAFLGEHIGER
ncbi:MAG: S9 family peptidase [Maricaulaceae bacterium]|jgi:dipeptidyl aminopeptidase/acylaminoacyl peptidase